MATGWDASQVRYGRVTRTIRSTSRRAVKAALAQLEVDVASGRVGLDDPNVAALFDRWFHQLERLGRTQSTLYNYRKYVDRELVQAIGKLRLSKLTARHLDSLYASLTKRGLAPATIRQIHAVVHSALNQAVRWGLVSRNVAPLASAPSQPQREQHPPTASQVHALIEAATDINPLFGLYVRVVAATGMRRAEACGLRWSDIDLPARRLTVARSHITLPGVVVGDRPTKSRTARTVTLDAGTVEVLRSGWRAARQGARFCGVDDDTRRAGYVFSFDPTEPRPGGAISSAPAGFEFDERQGRGSAAARPPPLAGHPAPRRRRPGPDRRGPARPRRRHDHHEDLRTPHRTGR